MKKTVGMMLFILTLLIIPFSVHAKDKDYKTLNFKEALADEEIELKNSTYEENDDQITIYLFRGKGCGYCRAYLEFMNSVSEEYGKYFKIVSYEVWNNSDNSKLMKQVANFLDEDVSGVPFIVIGDQTFTGYTETYNEKIKDAITKLYNTKKEDRYDVFVEMEKEAKNQKEKGMSSGTVIIWNMIFTIVASTVILIVVNKNFKRMNDTIQSLQKDLQKVTTKSNSKTTKKTTK